MKATMKDTGPNPAQTRNPHLHPAQDAEGNTTGNQIAVWPLQVRHQPAQQGCSLDPVGSSQTWVLATEDWSLNKAQQIYSTKTETWVMMWGQVSQSQF